MHDLDDMGVRFEIDDTKALLAHFRVRPILIDWIKDTQDKDYFVVKALKDPQGRKR